MNPSPASPSVQRLATRRHIAWCVPALTTILLVFYSSCGFCSADVRQAPAARGGAPVELMLAGAVGIAMGVALSAWFRRRSVRRHHGLSTGVAMPAEREGIIALSQDLIAVVNASGCFVQTNPAFGSVLHYGANELIGKPFLSLVHPQDLEAGREAFARLQGGELVTDLEIRVRAKSGGWRWIAWRATPEQDSGEIYAVGRDIDARKQAQQELFEEKERAQVTLHSIGDGVIATDALGIVEYINATAERLTGWTADQARGSTLTAVFNIIDETSRAPEPNPVADCLAQGRVIKLRDRTVLVSRSGEEYPIQDSVAPIRGRSGEVLGAVIVFKDVTQERRMVREMARHATYDALTGLVNRREFERRLQHAVAGAKRQGGQHALCYIDLDQFKIVNDTAGHRAGDELLKQIAVMLAEGIRERDTLARLGGDEFGLLLDNCPADKAHEIAATLVGTVRDFRFSWEGRTFQIGASIGLVPITARAKDTAQILSQADVACYTAKELGRNRVHVYQLEAGEPVRRHLEIFRAAELRDALESNRFRLFCQPVASLSGDSNRPTYYELLVRLLNDEGAILLPGAFIPAAERYGIMGAIDRWAIETAFAAYPEVTAGSADTCLAINLSGNSLSDDGLLSFVQGALEQHSIAPHNLCFEITETAAIHNLAQASRFITELKELGCRFALDDFGSGLSSFTYLKKLPVDYLKIDGSFVTGIAEDPIDHAMVESINNIGHTMGMKTIAEYCESDEILRALYQLGVDYAQGFRIAAPSPLAPGSCAITLAIPIGPDQLSLI